MKKLSRFLQMVLVAGIYSMGSMQAALGEDIEIFFAPAADVEDVRPNIMFIIDTSGSMGWGVDGTRDLPDGMDSRMEVVQDVMDEVLTDITKVNAG